MFDQDKSEVVGMWILALVVVSLIVLGGLGYAGKFTGTAVERAVFEQSYQKKAADSAAYATFKAQLVEIEATLSGMSATDERRNGLEAQASAIRVQLAAMGAR